jgi:hypothetical protein
MGDKIERELDASSKPESLHKLGQAAAHGRFLTP